LLDLRRGVDAAAEKERHRKADDDAEVEGETGYPGQASRKL
jgi:hypothetical protein